MTLLLELHSNVVQYESKEVEHFTRHGTEHTSLE